MDIFIKSQDEKFFGKVDGFTIKQESAERYYICGNGNQCLGVYIGEERCIEILGEIQRVLAMSGVLVFKNADVTTEILEYLNACKGIMISDKTDEANITSLGDFMIYEMPKE